MSPIKFEVSVERIRQLGSRGNIEHMSTERAQAFISLYRGDIETALANTLRAFIAKKLGLPAEGTI